MTIEQIMNVDTLILPTTQLQPNDKTVYDVMSEHDFNDVDVSDSTFDMVIAFVLNDPQYVEAQDDIDAYDKFMYLLASNMKVVSTYGCRYGYEICADYCAFIQQNRDVLDAFLNDHNKDAYRPDSYSEAKLNDSNSNAFYRVYIYSIHSLIAGNYCDEDYEELCSALLEKLGGHHVRTHSYEHSCPSCGSHNVTMLSSSITDQLKIKHSCEDCGYTFEEVYNLQYSGQCIGENGSKFLPARH